VRPRSRPTGLGTLAVVALVGMSGCSDSGTPSAPTPPRPAQSAAAKPAPPPAPPPAPAVAPYAYAAKGRRDPFQPLIKPRVETAKARPKTGLAALDVKELKLAGIIWGGRGYFALVEAPNGAGYVVRLNDTVGDDARVAKITAEAVMFEVRTSPVPQSQARLVELRLRKEE
jgi:Tfp pilus assembly protein PilP